MTGKTRMDRIRFENSERGFTECFGPSPSLLTRAPGRLEILGNHTDYNEGYVLSGAVDCETWIAWSLEGAGKACEVASAAIPGVESFDLDRVESPMPRGHWINFARGMTREFILAGFRPGSFKAFIDSTVPMSAGMSSSASLEMALAMGLNELTGAGLSPRELAEMGQRCENDYIGVSTGLMDQLTCMMSREGHLLLSEYRNLNVDWIPFPPGWVFVVGDSGVKHDLAAEYGQRRIQCEKVRDMAADWLPGVTALRDLSIDSLATLRNRIDPQAYRRSLHVVGENERVLRGAGLLADGKIEDFGTLLFESHESSVRNFENSCKELDFMVETAMNSGVCVGARLSGGGFGGISIHLVRACDADGYARDLTLRFKSALGRNIRTMVCRLENGAAASTPAL